MRNGEGRQRETRALNEKARRFMEVAGLMVGMFAAPDVALAGHDSREDNNAWAQLLGENVEERNAEIDRLEREASSLRARIARLEIQIETGEKRYARDLGLKFEEEGELKDLSAELRRKERAITSLEKGMEGAVERKNARRGPTLNLSAKALGNAKIADYYARYAVGFQDHALYFNVDDGTPDGARGRLAVGSSMESVQFYFQDGNQDLLIVFTATDGTHKTLKLDDGNGTFYESDERGKPASRR